MQNKIMKLNEIISEYNQYKRSRLHEDIISVLKCIPSEADVLAHTHCNMVSFWALNYASDKTDLTYEDYFRNCLKKNMCTKDGNILVTKTELCKKIFDYDFEIMQYKDFDIVFNPEKLNPEKLYQMRLIDTSHFMCCYLQDNILMLSDTSKRGVGVVAKDADRVDKPHFAWILEV